VLAYSRPSHPGILRPAKRRSPGFRITYYRWRREFGGLRSDQVKRLKELEAENARLRKAIADLTLDKQILAEAARGNS
jgi:transposase